MDSHWSTRVRPTFGKVKQKVNENARKCSRFHDIAESGGYFQKLKNPARPQLEEIDFYDGSRIPLDDYAPETVRLTGTTKDHVGTRPVELERLLADFDKGHIAFVGPSGSGKTTLLRSIAQDILDQKFENLSIELVCYVQCANFRPDKLITAGELIFHNTEDRLSPEEVETVVKFAKEYPNRVIFILDSLDSSRYTVDGVYEVLELTKAACPEAIISNFLSGNLFPGCRIITSSREYAIRNFKGAVRPQKVIALVGLSADSIKSIMEGYVGEKEALEIIVRLRQKSPSQLALCSTPVLLVYTLMGIQIRSNFDPTTMSRILIIVFNNLLRSPLIRQKYILPTLYKLAKLAFKGAVEGRTFFSVKELVEVGLDPSSDSGLTILAPGGLSQKILQGSDLVCFTHLSLQEILAALHIAKVSTGDEVISEKIHAPRFSVIRRFLSGILLDDGIREEVESLIDVDTENIERKRDKLKKSLQEELNRTSLGPDFLELLLSLHEAKDGAKDLIGDSLKKIEVEDLPLSVSDVHAIGSVMARCKHLSDVDVQNCNIDSSSMTSMETLLETSELRISQLWMGRNPNLGLDGMSAVGKISRTRFVTKLHLYQCNLFPDLLQALKVSLGQTEMALLDLGGNVNMGVEGVTIAREIVANCGVQQFDLQKCRLDSKQLHALAKFPSSTQLTTLRLSEEMVASREDVGAIARLLPHVTRTFSLLGWTLQAEDQVFLQDELNTLDTRLVIRFGDTSATEMTSIKNQSIIVTPKSGDEECEEIIGPDGGTIKIGTCKAIFPGASMQQTTMFRLILTQDPGDCPENYVSASPMMNCNPSVIFEEPVTLQLFPWYSTEFDDVIIYVMTKESKEAHYKVLHRMKLKDCRPYITFQCSHFSPFWALIERVFLGKVQCSVLTVVYYDGSGNFAVILHGRDESSVDESMSKQGFSRAPVFFDQRAIYLDDNLSFSLTCIDPQRTAFNPREIRDFQLGNQFGDSRQKHLQFVLLPVPDPGQLLRISASLHHKGERQDLSFNLQWPRRQDSQRRLEIQDSPHITIVQGDQIIDKSVTDHSIHGGVTAHNVATGGSSVQSDERGASSNVVGRDRSDGD